MDMTCSCIILLSNFDLCPFFSLDKKGDIPHSLWLHYMDPCIGHVKHFKPLLGQMTKILADTTYDQETSTHNHTKTMKASC